MSKSRVIVIGHSSDIARNTIDALLTHHSNDVETHVLVRPNTSNTPLVDTFKSRGAHIVYGGLLEDTVETLVQKLDHNYAAVLSLVGNIPPELISEGQSKLIQAIASIQSIKLIFPSEFGIDHELLGRDHALAWGLNKKDDIRNQIKQLQKTKRPDLNYAFVVSNAFTNWLIPIELGFPFYGIDVKKKHVLAPVSKNTKLTTTTPEDIGRITAAAAVAGIHDDPTVLNKTVGIASDTLTYGEIRQLLETHTGEKWQLEEKPLTYFEQLKQDALNNKKWIAASAASYAIVIGNQIGVYREVADSWNGKHNIPVTSLKQWLQKYYTKDKQ